MGQPQRIEEPFRRKRSKKINKRNPSVNEKIDAFTQVSEFQKEAVRRELLYSNVGLILKFGLFIVFATSLVNLGLASHQRVNRNLELSYLLEKESKKLHKLRLRLMKCLLMVENKVFLRSKISGLLQIVSELSGDD